MGNVGTGRSEDEVSQTHYEKVGVEENGIHRRMADVCIPDKNRQEDSMEVRVQIELSHTVRHRGIREVEKSILHRQVKEGEKTMDEWKKEGLLELLVRAYKNMDSMQNIMRSMLGLADEVPGKGLIPETQTYIWACIQALSIFSEHTDENNDMVCDILYSETTDEEKVKMLTGKEK